MYENDFSFVRLFKAYGRLFDFAGRSTRTELLGYVISVWLLSTIAHWVVIALFGAQVEDIASQTTLTSVISLVFLVPMPGLAVRRAHDIGLPGAAALLPIVPWVAIMAFGAQLAAYPVLHMALAIVYIAGLVMLFWKPQEGDNRYGPNPRLVDDQWVEAE